MGLGACAGMVVVVGGWWVVVVRMCARTCMHWHGEGSYGRRNESGAGEVGSIIGRLDSWVERVSDAELWRELFEATHSIRQLWRVPVTVQAVVEGEFELQLAHTGHV